MSVHCSLVIFVIVAAIVPAISFATEFIVGDDGGWKLGVDYQKWANGKRFFVGDALVFKYKAGVHNVFKVNGTEFQNCTVPTNNSLGSFTGNDTIKLLATGNKWYICGVNGHCKGGMKLNITVLKSAPAPAPSTPPAPAPAPSAVPVPAPSAVPVSVPSAAPMLRAKEAIFKIFIGITVAIVAIHMVN